MKMTMIWAKVGAGAEGTTAMGAKEEVAGVGAGGVAGEVGHAEEVRQLRRLGEEPNQPGVLEEAEVGVQAKR